MSVHRRFVLVTSRTPLYHAEDRQFYWNHCWYCGIELVYDKKLRKLKANSFTRDHVVPASSGGSRRNNTVPACNSCNMRKKNMSLDAFRVRLVGKGKLFFGENKEQELKDKLQAKQISLSFNAQLESLMINPPVFEFKPKPVKCFVRRELVLHTGLTRILRRLF